MHNKCFNRLISFKKNIKNEMKSYAKDCTHSTTFDIQRDDHVYKTLS